MNQFVKIILYLIFKIFFKKKQIREIRRRGKFIILELNSGFLYFHLRMTGKILQQIKYDKENKSISNLEI